MGEPVPTDLRQHPLRRATCLLPDGAEAGGP